jgi:proline iminopeptidase
MRMAKLMRLRIHVVVVLFLMCPVICQETFAGKGWKPSVSEGEFTAEINGLKLWYKVSGRGPVCILPTPGWGPSSELYYLKMKPLESMFTMIYLDTRGSGRSERPDPHAYAMQDFVADIEGLRRHVGVDTIWLMGHSDGGRMILNYAFEHSDRVKGLILVDAPVQDTSHGVEREKRMLARKDQPWFDSAFGAFHRVPTTQKEFDAYIRVISPFFFTSIENLEKNRDVFDSLTVSFDAQRGVGLSDQSSVNLETFLPAMKIPTLVIVGQADFICPPSASEYLHREIARSKLLIVEHSGHFPWLENPEQFFGGIQAFLPKIGYRKNER